MKWSARWISDTHLVKDEAGHLIPTVFVTGDYCVKGGDFKKIKRTKKEGRGGRDNPDVGGNSDSCDCHN